MTFVRCCSIAFKVAESKVEFEYQLANSRLGAAFDAGVMEECAGDTIRRSMTASIREWLAQCQWQRPPPGLGPRGLRRERLLDARPDVGRDTRTRILTLESEWQKMMLPRPWSSSSSAGAGEVLLKAGESRGLPSLYQAEFPGGAARGDDDDEDPQQSPVLRSPSWFPSIVVGYWRNQKLSSRCLIERIVHGVRISSLVVREGSPRGLLSFRPAAVATASPPRRDRARIG